MPHLRLAPLAALLSLCVACQTAFAASGGASPAGPSAGILPPATRAIEVKVAEPVSDNLAYLVDELAGATGVVFTATETTRNMLRQTSTGLGQDLTIAPTEVWSWVESLLYQQGFLLSVTTSRAPHVLAVVPAIPTGGQFQPRSWLSVPATEIASLEEHPALIVATVLDLPYTDVRQLGNSLRALVADPSGAQGVLPVGNTNSVILSGPARQVLDLVRMLRVVDEQSREVYERAEALRSEAAGVTAPDAAPPAGGGAR